MSIFYKLQIDPHLLIDESDKSVKSPFVDLQFQLYLNNLLKTVLKFILDDLRSQKNFM